MKRLICLLLVVALLAPCTAGAAGINGVISGELIPHTFNIPNGVYDEYESAIDVRRVSMEVGQYLVVSPMHWLDTLYGYYTYVSIESSNPSVVEAGQYSPLSGRSGDGMVNIASGDRGFISVCLHAKKAGKATVTLSLHTDIPGWARAVGWHYTDPSHSHGYSFTKTIEVTVGEEPLKISVTPINGSSGAPVKQASIYMSDVYTEMSRENPTYELYYAQKAKEFENLGKMLGLDPTGLDFASGFGTLFGASPLVGALTLATSAVQGRVNEGGWSVNNVLESVASGLTLLEDTKAVSPLAVLKNFKTLKNLNWLAFLSDIVISWSYGQVGHAWDLAKMQLYFDELNRLSGFSMPSYMPQNLKLRVTLENQSDQPITDVALQLGAQGNVSLDSPDGPWGGTTRRQINEIAPHSTVTREIAFFPKVVKNALNDSDAFAYVYTGHFDVDCTYAHPDYKQALSAQASANLPVYSSISWEDVKKLNKDMLEHGEAYQKYFGKSMIDQIIYVACPVELLVYDADGNLLATVGTDDEEGYQNEGLAVGADGEKKYFIVDPDYADAYRLQLRATGAGTMNTTSIGYSDAAGMNANTYELELTEGDLFDVALAGDAAGTLTKVEADGQRTALEADFALNSETMGSLLAESGVSDWALAPVEHAMLRGLVPDVESESYQDEESLSVFCEGLLNVYESYFGIPVGYTAYQAQQEYGEETDAQIAAAVMAGLLPEEYMEKAAKSDGVTLARGEAAQAALAFLTATGLGDPYENKVDTEEGYIWVTPESPDAEEAVAQALEKGLFAEEAASGAKLKAKDALTREQSIAAIDELWVYLAQATARNDAIAEAVLRATDDLTIHTDKSVAYNIATRASDEAPDSTVLHDFSLYLPATDMGGYLYADPVEVANDVIGMLADPGSREYVKLGDLFDGDRLKALLGSGATLAGARAGANVYAADGVEELYRWTPVYFADANGAAAEDAVYLFVVHGGEEADERTADLYQLLSNGMYRVDCLFIADEEIVRDFLNAIRPELEEKAVSAESLAELAKGAEGEAVKALQRALCEQGFLDAGAVDGKYGTATADAVSAFQEASGIEATGVADPATQETLFVKNSGANLLLNWLDGQ